MGATLQPHYLLWPGMCAAINFGTSARTPSALKLPDSPRPILSEMRCLSKRRRIAPHTWWPNLPGNWDVCRRRSPGGRSLSLALDLDLIPDSQFLPRGGVAVGGAGAHLC